MTSMSADLESCLAALYRACQLTWGVALLPCTVFVCVAFEHYMDLHALSLLNVTKFNNDEDADSGEDDYDDAIIIITTMRIHRPQQK